MASQRVPIREFKARLSYYLAQTAAGYDVIEVTSHKKIVARVTGVPGEAADGVATLIGSGAASWGGGKPAGSDIRLSKGGRSVSVLVIDGRG
jgi:antitoxin (DNA-binding transcriptional repressor) of toxin-antitoxin stability system